MYIYIWSDVLDHLILTSFMSFAWTAFVRSAIIRIKHLTRSHVLETSVDNGQCLPFLVESQSGKALILLSHTLHLKYFLYDIFIRTNHFINIKFIILNS